MTQKAALFLALAYGLCWGLIAGFYVLAPNGQSAQVVLGACMLTPALAVLAVQRGVYGAPWAEVGLRWRWSWWYAVALALPMGLAVLTTGASALVPGTNWASPSTQVLDLVAQLAPDRVAEVRQQLEAYGAWIDVVLVASQFANAAIAAPTFAGVLALGEELGWRGLLHAECARYGFWGGAAAVGVAWGLWHAPMIVFLGHNYPEHPWLGVAMMVVLCVLLSPLFAFLRERADTVLAAAIVHGAFNALAALPYLLVAGRSNLWIGPTGVAGLTVLLAANLALAWYRASGQTRTISLSVPLA
jgi:membrane protease YdiL (CAAX protease family)